MKPLFSIVIASYNHGQVLSQAIDSVLAQDCQGVELIVVDGGSTDNSIDIIRRYAKHLGGKRFGEEHAIDCEPDQRNDELDRMADTPNKTGTSNQYDTRMLPLRFEWCSEKDRGQSHAFNKGFQKAQGRYLTWLNADDILFPATLRKAKAKLLAHPDCQWLTGNFLRFLQDGSIMEWKRGPHFLPNWLQRPNAPIVVFGPTSFFAKSLYQSMGGMDERLHYIMDTDLWIRFMQMGVKQLRLNHCCWGFRMHEDSKTAEFDRHECSDLVKAKMHEEWELVIRKTNYKCSRFLRATHKVWRIVDGSLLYSFWLQMCKRHLISLNSLQEGGG